MGIFSKLMNKGQFLKTRQDNLDAVKAGLRKANKNGSMVFQCFDCLASFHGTTATMSHADSESTVFAITANRRWSRWSRPMDGYWATSRRYSGRRHRKAATSSCRRANSWGKGAR